LSEPDAGWTLNPRGAGYFFGMDEARRFNAANGLRMIVRSHELVQRGWAIGGEKDMITVFSAADYRNKGNDGAAVRLLRSALLRWRTCVSPVCSSRLDAHLQRRQWHQSQLLQQCQRWHAWCQSGVPDRGAC